MRRFFTEPQNITDSDAYIYEDSNHIKKVLRMEVGEKILIFDGTGFEYTAELSEIGKDKCTARITDKSFSTAEPNVKISLFQCLPKSGKMETIIQKAVELGVYEVIPVASERCVVRLRGNSAEEKVKRWNKVSVEAVKQCGRGIIPKVQMPVDFKTAAVKMKELDLPLMPYENLGHEGKHGLKDVLNSKRDAKRIGIVVGPEGGFSDNEAKFAAENGLCMIGLGKRILRTETVANALIPIIMYHMDEL